MISSPGSAATTDIGMRGVAAPRAPRGTRKTQPPRSTRAAARITSVTLLTTACGTAIVWGWLHREESNLVPENGLGYGLGIAGLALMILLVAYSVRKRARFARYWGPTRSWFLVHMWMGLVGPTLIIFHANFSLGSLNSQVALFTVLVVASSGVVGRLVYTRIHYGLSGHRATLRELKRAAEAGRGALRDAVEAAPGLTAMLETYENFALRPARGLGHGVWRLLMLRRRTREMRADARHVLTQAFRRRRRDPGHREAVRQRRRALAAVNAYISSVRRVTTFTAYERTFSLWHALHLPLCYLLFGTAAIHVVAVHMY